jgi:hypothetical protein
MSIYPGDRPLGRFITDREARKLEIFPELVEALESIEWSKHMKFPSDNKYHKVCPSCEREVKEGHHPSCIVGQSIDKARGEMI